MKTAPVIMLPLLALLLTGCLGIVVPVPSDGQTHGQVITPAGVKFIVVGRTTRAEVISQLGDGFRDSPRLPVMAYAWEKPATGWAWGVASLGESGGALGSCSENSHWRAYFLEFDSSSRVSRATFVHLSQRNQSLDEQLEDWALRKHKSFEETGGGIFNPATGAPCLFDHATLLENH